MAIENRTGSPVEKENFYGRKGEVTLAWKKITNGNSLILAAPRRVGKTSFSKKILEQAEQKGWKVLYLDLERIQTEKAFVKYFVDELIAHNWMNKIVEKGKRLINSLAKIKPKIATGGVELSVEWQAEKGDVYEKLKELIKPDEKTLIVVDELAIFLNYLIEASEDGIKNVEFFLNWLRGFRQVKGNQIRWIFCSSVGIENFVSMHNLSNTLNDVDSFELGGLNNKESHGLFTELGAAKEIELSNECIDYALTKLGWALPFYIQVLFAEIHTIKELEDIETISNAVIDKAYTKLLNKPHFNTWDERLREYSTLQTYIRLVLDHLSQTTDGEKRETLHSLLYRKIEDDYETNRLLSEILRILTNDGYIIREENGKYLFRSFLLRDFWYNKFIA